MVYCSDHPAFLWFQILIGRLETGFQLHEAVHLYQVSNPYR